MPGLQRGGLTAIERVCAGARRVCSGAGILIVHLPDLHGHVVLSRNPSGRYDEL